MAGTRDVEAGGKPVPLPDQLTAAYWAAADEGRLAIQRCDACGRLVHPPEACCPRCNAALTGTVDVSGRGRVYSYTVVRDNVTRGFEAEAPYVVALVELTEQERLLVIANIVGATPDDVRVGAPVDVAFEEVAPGRRVPQFRLVDPA
jgi:uncharacterized OB-fold protein